MWRELAVVQARLKVSRKSQISGTVIRAFPLSSPAAAMTHAWRSLGKNDPARGTSGPDPMKGGNTLLRLDPMALGPELPLEVLRCRSGRDGIKALPVPLPVPLHRWRQHARTV
jgi:hypothetical protein